LSSARLQGDFLNLSLYLHPSSSYSFPFLSLFYMSLFFLSLVRSVLSLLLILSSLSLYIYHSSSLYLYRSPSCVSLSLAPHYIIYIIVIHLALLGLIAGCLLSPARLQGEEILKLVSVSPSLFFIFFSFSVSLLYVSF
jgi:hypothetical protein